MNLSALAQTRAECAARLEALDFLSSEGDPEENAAHLRAQALARAAYREAELAYAGALATLSVAEIRALGLPHA